jgi:putative DNA primase/helicase
MALSGITRDDLGLFKSWVLWRWECRGKDKDGKDKWTKPPYQPSGMKAGSDNSQTWSSYDTVIAAFASGKFDGIGFALLGSSLGAYDLDDCRDPETGVIASWANSLLASVASYAEVTPSGKGLRIIGLATGPSVHRKFSVPGGGSVEVYRNAKRYITITGLALPGHDPEVLARIDDAIDRTVAEHDKGKAKPAEPREDAAHGAGKGAAHDDGAHAPGDDADKLDRVIRLGENSEFGGDRSNAVFFVACEMLRRGSVDAAIRSVLLDRTNGISEHVYKDDPERCVRRTIERAREMVGGEAKSKALALTDLGNARRLITRYGDVSRFVFARAAWMTWSDGFWRRDQDGAVMRMAKAVVEEMFAEAARIADEAMRNALRKHALLSQNANRIAAMVTLARTEVEVVLPIEKLDADPMLLGVANGVVDLRTGSGRRGRRTTSPSVPAAPSTPEPRARTGSHSSTRCSWGTPTSSRTFSASSATPSPA